MMMKRLKLISAGHQSWPYVGWVGEPELALRPHRSHASLSPVRIALQALHCKHRIAGNGSGGEVTSAKTLTLTGSACIDDDEDWCFSWDP